MGNLTSVSVRRRNGLDNPGPTTCGGCNMRYLEEYGPIPAVLLPSNRRRLKTDPMEQMTKMKKILNKSPTKPKQSSPKKQYHRCSSKNHQEISFLPHLPSPPQDLSSILGAFGCSPSLPMPNFNPQLFSTPQQPNQFSNFAQQPTPYNNFLQQQQHQHQQQHQQQSSPLNYAQPSPTSHNIMPQQITPLNLQPLYSPNTLPQNPHIQPRQLFPESPQTLPSSPSCQFLINSLPRPYFNQDPQTNQIIEPLLQNHQITQQETIPELTQTLHPQANKTSSTGKDWKDMERIVEQEIDRLLVNGKMEQKRNNRTSFKAIGSQTELIDAMSKSRIAVRKKHSDETIESVKKTKSFGTLDKKSAMTKVKDNNDVHCKRMCLIESMKQIIMNKQKEDVEMENAFKQLMFAKTKKGVNEKSGNNFRKMERNNLILNLENKFLYEIVAKSKAKECKLIEREKQTITELLPCCQELYKRQNKKKKSNCLDKQIAMLFQQPVKDRQYSPSPLQTATQTQDLSITHPDISSAITRYNYNYPNLCQPQPQTCQTMFASPPNQSPGQPSTPQPPTIQPCQPSTLQPCQPLFQMVCPPPLPVCPTPIQAIPKPACTDNIYFKDNSKKGRACFRVARDLKQLKKTMSNTGDYYMINNCETMGKFANIVKVPEISLKQPTDINSDTKIDTLDDILEDIKEDTIKYNDMKKPSLEAEQKDKTDVENSHITNFKTSISGIDPSTNVNNGSPSDNNTLPAKEYLKADNSVLVNYQSPFKLRSGRKAIIEGNETLNKIRNGEVFSVCRKKPCTSPSCRSMINEIHTMARAISHKPSPDLEQDNVVMNIEPPSWNQIYPGNQYAYQPMHSTPITITTTPPATQPNTLDIMSTQPLRSNSIEPTYEGVTDLINNMDYMRNSDRIAETNMRMYNNTERNQEEWSDNERIRNVEIKGKKFICQEVDDDSYIETLPEFKNNVNEGNKRCQCQEDKIYEKGPKRRHDGEKEIKNYEKCKKYDQEDDFNESIPEQSFESLEDYMDKTPCRNNYKHKGVPKRFFKNTFKDRSLKDYRHCHRQGDIPINRSLVGDDKVDRAMYKDEEGKERDAKGYRAGYREGYMNNATSFNSDKSLSYLEGYRDGNIDRNKDSAINNTATMPFTPQNALHDVLTKHQDVGSDALERLRLLSQLHPSMPKSFKDMMFQLPCISSDEDCQFRMLNNKKDDFSIGDDKNKCPECNTEKKEKIQIVEEPMKVEEPKKVEVSVEIKKSKPKRRFFFFKRKSKKK